MHNKDYVCYVEVEREWQLPRRVQGHACEHTRFRNILVLGIFSSDTHISEALSLLWSADVMP